MSKAVDVQPYVFKTHIVIFRRTFKYVGDDPIPPVFDQLDLVATLSVDVANNDPQEPHIATDDMSEKGAQITSLTIPLCSEDRSEDEDDVLHIPGTTLTMYVHLRNVLLFPRRSVHVHRGRTDYAKSSPYLPNLNA